jgi:DMSO/TMAO reductase YedYZ heme-binding membrane subunit
MKAALRILLVLLVVLLCIVASEAGMIAWLNIAPFDVTGGMFWRGILPLQVLIIGIATLALSRIYRRSLALYAGVFVVAHMTIYGMFLRSLANPWEDVATYWGAVIIANAIWLSIAYRLSRKAS